ncbi:hypothetical protein AWH56_021430 [Anaerobacillus isosaccharinicus]|uniref:DUF3139 domain-containing protein n=1 Tax=Anaerobacillus isosaccharinicus TaxID=1532552 RepID=A0A1S2MDT1_9BACI|nr:hypothetical protein [Anaerobacillus isosaccharinicus]MBA5586530.1 hypothetical protein [Anaerobacillus isosaccharinicus]QOY35229.1 hypothetical protein AWH56_021430 [Anaerobacillus isosaccharinicus]
MHPTELIELLFVGSITLLFLVISFFLKGNWRKIGFTLTLVILVAYSAFYILRPYWIDSQIIKKVEILEVYLEERYPDEGWLISTVPHREAGYKHLNPYYIGVVFFDEPEVTYHYRVENKDSIKQIGFSTDKSGELKFWERNESSEEEDI